MFTQSSIDRPTYAGSASPLLLLVLTGILLGATLPVTREAGKAGWSPLAFTFWAALGSSICLLMSRRSGSLFTLGVARYSLIAGILSVAIPNSLVFLVMPSLGTAMTSLVYTLPPLFTYAFGLLLRMEQFRPTRLVGVLLGMSGVALLVVGRPIDAAFTNLSLLLALCIPLSVAAGNIYRKRYLPERIDARTLAGGMLLAGAVSILPLLLRTDVLLPAGMDWNLVVLQCGLTSIGYLVYFRFQKVADPVYFSQLGYVMSATGVLCAVLLFGEQLNVWMPIALLVIIAGVALVNRRLTPASRLVTVPD